MPPRPPCVHVVVPVHTPLHLAACVVSLLLQRPAPASIVVTADGTDPAVRTEFERARDLIATHAPTPAPAGTSPTAEATGQPAPSPGAGSGTPSGPRPARPTSPAPPRLLLVARPRDGDPRLNQVRNNGLRALDRAAQLAEDDLVVLLDSDTVLPPDAIGKHAALAAETEADVIIPYRVMLERELTATLDADRLAREPGVWAELAAGPGREAMPGLVRRHHRYRRQLRWRTVPGLGPLLIKPHKPKVIGGHHAVRIATLRAVNGYDERFVRFGYNDDDLTRRLYRLRPRPIAALAMDTIPAYHLWHPKGRDVRPTDTPGYEVFARPDWRARAEFGWDSPLAQPELAFEELGPAG